LPSCFLPFDHFLFFSSDSSLHFHKTFSFSQHPDSHICFFFLLLWKKKFLLFSSPQVKFFFLAIRIELEDFFMIRWAWYKKTPFACFCNYFWLFIYWRSFMLRPLIILQCGKKKLMEQKKIVRHKGGIFLIIPSLKIEIYPNELLINPQNVWIFTQFTGIFTIFSFLFYKIANFFFLFSSTKNFNFNFFHVNSLKSRIFLIETTTRRLVLISLSKFTINLID